MKPKTFTTEDTEKKNFRSFENSVNSLRVRREGWKRRCRNLLKFNSFSVSSVVNS